MFEAHSINAEHKDLIHDVAYDYYGQRMATCSSDQSVKVWDQDEQKNWILSANWKAHSGSVWKVTWAHPEFGQVLATCSFDRTAAIWEEIIGETPTQGERGLKTWIRRTNLVDSRTSVTDVKFGPKSLGLQLATCSTDGVIRIYEAPDVMNLSQWTLQHEIQCKQQCSCLTWSHSFSRLHPPMIAVGSDDNNPANGSKVAIYEYGGIRWTKTESLASVGINEPVHDIAFAPNLGRSYHLLAIATKDVRIVTLGPSPEGSSQRFDVQLTAQQDDNLSGTVWRVSWNILGTILASSGDDGCVRLWKANYMNSWKCIAVLRGDGTQAKSDTSTSSMPTMGQVAAPNQSSTTRQTTASEQKLAPKMSMPKMLVPKISAAISTMPTSKWQPIGRFQKMTWIGSDYSSYSSPPPLDKSTKAFCGKTHRLFTTTGSVLSEHDSDS
ncbi:Nucleoporin SEH1 [Frankliniella fusca]|uniref:Nucleoporin SEH1 n=1 Tax=Frankliniella fusca TaxID=407009 RepID=A0AAE1LQ38_9NEOP|nr:Nucleoporin SEH1 [Frankliniella fusca]